MHGLFGTPYYIAPEVLKKNYTEKCDLWSCGIILYVLLCGFPPFRGKTLEELTKKILKGSYSFNTSESSHLSDTSKDLIKKLLDINPIKRITA